MTITIREPRVSDLDDRDRDCIRALYDASCAYESFRSRYCLPVEGTCRWVLDDETFTAWEEGTSGLLWVTANVRGGKSVFANGYVEQVAKTCPDTVVGSFFFDTNAANEALSAVLHQILTKHPGATRHAREDFAAKGHHFTNDAKALWRVICDISRDFFADASEVLLVLDGVDQCTEPSKNAFINELAATFSGEAGKDVPGRLKVLVTSRPSSEIARVLRPIRKNTYFRLEDTKSPMLSGTPDFATLAMRRIAHLKGEDNTSSLSNDVYDVVDFRLNELRTKNVLGDDNLSFLRNELLHTIEDSFLWTSTLLKHLEGDSMARSAIEAAVEAAEAELHRFYEEALQKTSDAGRKLLQCMIAAEAPLTLSEINVTLALRDGVSSVEDLARELEPDIEHTVQSLGGFLVRITKGRVHLVHSTARGFLIRQESSPGMPQLDSQSCDIAMAGRCLHMLTGICEPDETSFVSPLDKPRFKAFYCYAAENWQRFAEGAFMLIEFDPKYDPSPTVVKLWESVCVLCNPQRNFLGVWWPSFAGGSRTKADLTRHDSQWYISQKAEGLPRAQEHLLHRAASNDSVHILRALLVSATHLSVTDVNDDGVDVLSVAVSSHSWSVVPWILTEFPDTPLQRESALGTALRSNNAFAVALLLSTSPWDVYWSENSVSLEGMKPLFSIDRMELSAVELLTRNLSYACLWGRTTVVSELIKGGADVNRDSGGVSPLLAAVLAGNAALVDTLLEHNASPDTPCSPTTHPSRVSLPPLNAKTCTLSAEFISTFWSLLWEYLGPNCFGITPLGLAAQLNHTSISKSLKLRGDTEETTSLALRRAFPLRPTDSTPSPYLHKITLQHLHLLKEPSELALSICHDAVARAPVAVIEELIRYRCLDLPRDAFRKTLLHVAAEVGNVEALAVLTRAASHGTLFARDDLGRTCLRVALQEGHGEAAKKILEANRKLGSQATGCKTMLHDAVYGGVRKGIGVVDDVLELGEEVDAKDVEGRTPLHHAVLATKVWDHLSGNPCGAVNVVKALVIAGAEYNLADNQNQTPLALASTILAEGAGLPAEVRAALEELEATLIRVPLWGDNRLDAGAIRGNYEQFLSEGRSPVDEADGEFGDEWMFESEECDDDEEDEDMEDQFVTGY